MTNSQQNPLPLDADAREQALDTNDSFIVQAPAGSGKTELLIQRYLKLLALVESPEQVLAITFTRKAAGEMRDRVMQSLVMAQHQAPEEPHRKLTWSLARNVLERDASQGWDLQSRPGRMTIMTIDSFNSVLARRISMPAGFTASAGISERPKELYDLAAERVLESLGSKHLGGRSIEILVSHLDNNLPRVVALLSNMLARRDHWLRYLNDDIVGIHREFLESSITRVIDESLQGVARAMPPGVLQELVSVAALAAEFAPETAASVHRVATLATPPLPRASEVDVWKALADMLLTLGGAVRKSVNVSMGFPPAEKDLKRRMTALLDQLRETEGVESALDSVRKLPPSHYTDGQWRVLESLMVVLQLAAVELNVLFGERDQTDYVAVAMAAVRSLGSEQAPTDLALYLDHRLQHILVDEFQDTSNGQYQLLRQLVAGWTPGDGRTLFCVGDPMQAIYRFREAKVGYYLDARARGIGELRLRPLTLEANFRSRPGIVDWVNQVFPEVFPPEEDQSMEAICYSPCQATRNQGITPAVELHGFLGRNDNAEAACVVTLTRQALSRSADGQIAVLVRARPHLRAITEAFRQARINYRAVDIESLADRPVVLDLLALTRALLHPHDRTAWLSVLHAPYCGLHEADLLCLAEFSGKQSIARVLAEGEFPGLSEDGLRRLDRCAQVLNTTMNQRGRRTLMQSVHGAWLALGGPAAATGPGDLEDAESFLSILGQAEQGGDLDDLQILDRLLMEQRAAGLSAADCRVQVMTIHKAKGLEFHTVILPGLGRIGANTESALLRWQEVIRHGERNDLLLAPLAPKGDDQDPLHAYLGRMERQRDQQELRRLLYVATTRAREQLHLLGHAREYNDGSVKADSGSLLGLLWAYARPRFEGLEAFEKGAEPSLQDKPLLRLVSEWEAPEPSQPDYLLPDSATATRAEEPRVEYDWASESIRLTGTVVHRWLQRMAQDGESAWTAQRVREDMPAIHVALRSLGMPGDRLSVAGARAVDAILGTLNDSKGRWVLFGDHKESWTELALTGVSNGATVNVIMDRVFIAADGTLWIVDYKSSRHEGSGLQAFLDSEKQRYAGQLERYVRLVGHWRPDLPVRAALYFPLMSAWCEL